MFTPIVCIFQALARAFQDMGQDENNDYKDLSLFLASGNFNSRNVFFSS